MLHRTLFLEEMQYINELLLNYKDIRYKFVTLFSWYSVK